MFRALTTERALLPLLLEVDGLPPAAYDERAYGALRPRPLSRA